MKRHVSMALVMSVALIIATAAWAAVTFYPETGCGFVGKGDVQSAFGWNNAALQNNADYVTFSYDSESVYLVTSEWETGNPDSPNGTKTHEITQRRRAAVICEVLHNARNHKQIDGFILEGFGEVTTDGRPIPAVGDILVDPQTGNPYPTDHIVTAVTLLSSTGGLYATYGGTSVLLQ